jgi:hypothetical protein
LRREGKEEKRKKKEVLMKKIYESDWMEAYVGVGFDLN